MWISFIKFYYQLPHEIKGETLPYFFIFLYYFLILLFNIIRQDFTKKNFENYISVYARYGSDRIRSNSSIHNTGCRAVLRIRTPMFLGLLDPDPDPLVRGMDPDPSIIKQK